MTVFSERSMNVSDAERRINEVHNALALSFLGEMVKVFFLTFNTV